MEKYDCIIVEDEPLAAEILRDYIAQVPFLNLTHTCSDALFAMEVLKSDNADVIFLDIHLPKLKGLDFIRTLKVPPQIIITTAYSEYALKGYELNVVDYLLKPIDFERFLMAINKLRPRIEQTQSSQAGNISIVQRESADPPHLFLNVGKKKTKVYFDDILFIESVKEYVRIVTREKSILVNFQLSKLAQSLDKQKFIRVHRSFIVAKSKIDSFNALEMEVAGKTIPIGRSYKEFVQNVLKGEMLG